MLDLPETFRSRFLVSKSSSTLNNHSATSVRICSRAWLPRTGSGLAAGALLFPSRPQLILNGNPSRTLCGRMAAPPSTAVEVLLVDTAQGSMELPVDAVLALMLPDEDMMLELRPHEEPDLQVRVTEGPAVSPARNPSVLRRLPLTGPDCQRERDSNP